MGRVFLDHFQFNGVSMQPVGHEQGHEQGHKPGNKGLNNMMRSRFSLVLMAISGLAFGGGSLVSAFNCARLVTRPQNDLEAFKRPWQHGALTHHYNNPRNHQYSGKAHSFAPPSRPSKKKGYPRSSGRFY